METDRASLSEEYELLRAAGATDACYRSLLQVHPIYNKNFLAGWSSQVEMGKKEGKKVHLPFSGIRQTDTNYHSCFLSSAVYTNGH